MTLLMRNTKKENVTFHFRDFKITRENVIGELFKILRSSKKYIFGPSNIGILSFKIILERVV